MVESGEGGVCPLSSDTWPSALPSKRTPQKVLLTNRSSPYLFQLVITLDRYLLIDTGLLEKMKEEYVVIVKDSVDGELWNHN